MGGQRKGEGVGWGWVSRGSVGLRAGRRERGAGKGESVTRGRVGGTTDSLGRRLVSRPSHGFCLHHDHHLKDGRDEC